jgi:hypothetical protein
MAKKEEPHKEEKHKKGHSAPMSKLGHGKLKSDMADSEKKGSVNQKKK